MWEQGHVVLQFQTAMSVGVGIEGWVDAGQRHTISIGAVGVRQTGEWLVGMAAGGKFGVESIDLLN